MSPATWPRDNVMDERLLRIDPRADSFDDARVRALPRMLAKGDLVVVNDAATIPASLFARTSDGAELEVRLLVGNDPDAPATWRAVLLGAGDWRTRTEDRAAPPLLSRGDRIRFGASDSELSAVVFAISPISPRLVTLRFDRTEAALWPLIYRLGRPVQYAYVARPLALWHVQTSYAARPWASELPSAGRPLSWAILLDFASRGIGLATLTHAAGLSSTGDPALDRALPLPERFDIPHATAEAIVRAKKSGGRIVAVGTTVVRALEGSAKLHSGEIVGGAGITDLVIGDGFQPRVVDGLFTGLHERSATHFALLGAFAPRALIERAYTHAEASGYLYHEFGDSNLILPSAV